MHNISAYTPQRKNTVMVNISINIITFITLNFFIILFFIAIIFTTNITIIVIITMAAILQMTQKEAAVLLGIPCMA